jgi:hypothetical protein
MKIVSEIISFQALNVHYMSYNTIQSLIKYALINSSRCNYM